jgi:hypothetical protein
VRASADRAYASVLDCDLGGSWMARMLFAMRGLKSAQAAGTGGRAPRPVVAAFERLGFVRLFEDPPHEIVIGVVGRFWTSTGELRDIGRDGFASFDEAGYAKACWNFQIEPAGHDRVRVSTETRIRCLDRTSRRKFRLYWMVIGPFSGVIRKEMLREIRGRAESAVTAAAN